MQNRTARTPRFYVPNDIQCHTDLTLDKRISHHLVTVLRARKNDRLLLFNGDGHDYSAVVLDTGQRGAGRRALLKVQDRKAVQTESPLHVTLVQCISRTDRMDISLRQAVELGVACLQPVYSQHSVKAPEQQRAEKRWAHWQSVVISACEQSGRARLPELAQASDLPTWINRAVDPTQGHSPVGDERARLSFVLSPNAERSLSELLQEKQDKISGENPAITLLAGPESGFDPLEIDLAVEHDMHAVSLGPRILRTETAGVAAITVIQSLYGDL